MVWFAVSPAILLASDTLSEASEIYEVEIAKPLTRMSYIFIPSPALVILTVHQMIFDPHHDNKYTIPDRLFFHLISCSISAFTEKYYCLNSTRGG